MSFVNLTSKVLKKIGEMTFDSIESSSGVFSYKIELQEKVDIKRLCLHSHIIPQCYFASKDNSREDFALGSAKTFRRLDEAETLDRYLEDENLTLFGGKRFDPLKNIGNEWRTLGDIYFFLPRIHFQKNEGNTFLTFFFTDADLNSEKRIKSEIIFEIHRALSFGEKSQVNPYYSFDHQLPGEKEWGRKIKGCLDIFNNGSVGKIVLSRKQIFTSKAQSDLKYQLGKTKIEGNYIFYFKYSEKDAFLSVSPEKLFSVRNGRIEVDALAGSAPRGKSEKEDKENGDQLLRDQKELNEHRFVSDNIIEGLESLGLRPEFTIAESLMKLPYIQHIHSLITSPMGRHTKVLDIIDALHPTPAVGGAPRQLA